MLLNADAQRKHGTTLSRNQKITKRNTAELFFSYLINFNWCDSTRDSKPHRRPHLRFPPFYHLCGSSNGPQRVGVTALHSGVFIYLISCHCARRQSEKKITMHNKRSDVWSITRLFWNELRRLSIQQYLRLCIYFVRCFRMEIEYVALLFFDCRSRYVIFL